MNKEYKVDLHTHSIISHDGGISEVEYKRLFDSRVLDCIAVTDHNEISFAKELKEKFRERIIVGEEIMTTDGEIIGLFLTGKIQPKLSAKETVKQIHAQGGIVYIPHPFETVRKGISSFVLEQIINEVDIIETFNARSFQRKTIEKAKLVAQQYNCAACASSDAHGIYGIGTTYSVVSEMPTQKTLCTLLKEGMLVEKYASWVAMLYPKYNVIRKFLRI